MSTLEVKAIQAPTGYDLQMPAGAVIQTVTFQDSGSLTGTTSTSFVATGLTKTITPKFASSKIRIDISFLADAGDTSSAVWFTVKRGSTNLSSNSLSAFTGLSTVANGRILTGISHSYLDSPNTTSATTYEVYMKSGSSSHTVRYRCDESEANIILTEIAG